jgi:Effector Associated Constant Component 1
MQIQIRCVGEDSEAGCGDLYRWLLDDPDARRNAQLELRSIGPAEGDLGVMEILQLVVGSGFSAAALGVSIAQWKQQLMAAGPRFSISFEKDGRKVTVSGSNPEEIERAIQELNKD